MSTPNEKSNVNTHRTRWQALSAWFTAFEEGMNYGPNEYAVNSIQVLSQKVAQLETKVNELLIQKESTQ